MPSQVSLPSPPLCYRTAGSNLLSLTFFEAQILESIMMQDTDLAKPTSAYRLLTSVGGSLPQVTPPTSPDIDLHFLASVFSPPSQQDPTPAQVQQIATMLAFWGWTPHTVAEDRVTLDCQFCFRSVGCWNFPPLPQNPATALAAIDSALAAFSSQLSTPVPESPFSSTSSALVSAAHSVSRSLHGLLTVATASGRPGMTGSGSPMSLDSVHEAAAEGTPTIHGGDEGSPVATPSSATSLMSPTTGPRKAFGLQSEHRWFCPFQKTDVVTRRLSALTASSTPSTPVSSGGMVDLLGRHVSP